MRYYFVDDEKNVIETDEKKYNWLVLDSAKPEEIEQAIEEFELPDDIFVGTEYPEEVSRMERLYETKLEHPFSLVVINLDQSDNRIEKKLTPISFVLSDNLLITCIDRKTEFVDRLLTKHGNHLNSFEKIITYTLLDIYTHYVKELREMKKRIDALDKAARKTTENEELYKQADLERDIVYIDHTLRDQRETMDQLWNSETFIKRLDDEQLLYDVHLRQRQTEKMIEIYRDLLESIGDLFNGMMDNNLNHIMKYLDSAALIISVPALFAGIWGMNTGGLPGKSSALGFILVVFDSSSSFRLPFIPERLYKLKNLFKTGIKQRNLFWQYNLKTRRNTAMTEPKLIDPRNLYHTEKFPKQDQDTPALQQNMIPVPDCGEESYEGNNQLENRRVLITGGDSGIGRAAAIAFAREGADIALQFFPGEEKDAEEVAKYVKDAGRKIVLLPFDLRDEQAPKEIIDKAVSELGGLDTMVLNAGQQISCQSIAELPLEQVKDTFMINIIAMFALVKEAVPHIPAGGAIVTTTSVQAFNPSEHLLDYAATKASIANFTIGLAKQLAPKGIRVNGVAPGPIWTPLQLDEGQPSDSIPEFGQQSLLERAGQPGELAPVYVFLASNKASYVTAQIYGVTGGEAINL